MSAVSAPSAVSSSPSIPVVGAIGAWLTTTDHKRIGRLFIGLSVIWLLGVSVVSTILGFERVADATNAFDVNAVPQLFAFTRVGLMFGVALPMLIGLAVAVVPMQVGARSIAVARVASLGFWAWAAGSAMVIVSILGNGGPGGGNVDLVDLYLLGFGLGLVGLLAASVSLCATVMTARCPGMTLDRVPMLSWSALVAAVSVILTVPVALGSVIYVAVDHHFGRLAFGGNKGIDTWLGWSLGHPQSFVYALMSFGILADIAPVAARRRQLLRGGMLVAIGLVSTVVLGTVSQTPQVFEWKGSASDKVSSAIPFALFNLLPLLGAVVVIALVLFTLVNGKPRLLAPFVPAFLGVGMVVTGMVGNAIEHVSSAGVAGTVFGEGVSSYIGYGAVLSAFAGIVFWAPKLWGSTPPAPAVLGVSVLAFIGIVLSSLPYYVAGFADQPAGVVGNFDYSGPSQLWNGASMIGHAIVALVTLLAFAGHFRGRTAATEDPYDAHTLEWMTASPAPAENFAETPRVSSSTPLLDKKVPAESRS
ncbi:MAG: hypothetical protein EBZ55_02620 [Actinobacteria bacterium]|nr:hypothetical protein [Actinomycetota bacterium]